jgi:hypothetical protein
MLNRGNQGTTQADPFAEPHQIALCQSIDLGYLTVWELRDGKTPSGYVRLSEPVAVTFTKVNKTEGVQEALQAINEMERAARNELSRKLSEFADRRASLLALTYQPEAE